MSEAILAPAAARSGTPDVIGLAEALTGANSAHHLPGASGRLVLMGVRVPMPTTAEHARGRPLVEILRQRRFITAMICGVVSYMEPNSAQPAIDTVYAPVLKSPSIAEMWRT